MTNAKRSGAAAKNLRLGRINALRPSVTLFTQSRLYNTLLIMLCLNDFIMSYSLWDKLYGNSWWGSLCISLGFVIMLDISVSVAGNVVKEFTCGLRSRKNTFLITAMLLLAFLAVYSVYLGLRLSMSNELFDTATDGTLTDKMSGNDAAHEFSDGVKRFASLYQAVSPLGTSIAAFGISFALSDPVSERIADCERIKVLLEERIAEIDKALEGADKDGGYGAYREEVQRRDDEFYDAFLKTIDKTSDMLKVRARETLCVKSANADALTYLTDDISAVLAKAAEKLPPTAPSAHSEVLLGKAAGTADKPAEERRGGELLSA